MLSSDPPRRNPLLPNDHEYEFATCDRRPDPWWRVNGADTPLRRLAVSQIKVTLISGHKSMELLPLRGFKCRKQPVTFLTLDALR
jgi:hypothetical protein